MPRLRASASLATLFVLLIAADPARAGSVYLSLGDSLAFGYDVSTPESSVIPSYGDQGFVRHFADALAARNGGVRPDVLNLGIVGEQSTSFFDPAGLSPTGPPRAWGLNLNYADGMLSQNDLMLAQIANQHTLGNTIDNVSLVFGANDIFALVGSPAFQTATPEQQQAMVIQTITATLTNYAAVLTELKTVAPEASIFLPGYYNPFPADLAPTDHAFYDLVLGAFNPAVQNLAAQFGATYVDLYTPFVGNELALTNIGLNDVHPNQAGYAVIGTAFVTASVPEPSSLISLALAAGILGGTSLTRRRFAARRSAA